MGLDRLIPGRKKPLEIEVVRSLRPLRNERVTTEAKEDGSVVLIAPLEEQGRGVAAVLARWMKLPATKTFELEPIGAYVWSLCDGRHTVEAIVQRLRERYKMNRLEAEAALTAFLRMLGQRRLISIEIAKGRK
jgi:hypothetical protein